MTDPGVHDGRTIAASIRQGDRFATIFDRHAPAIHRYLQRRVGEQAAEDVLGETFLIAFRRRGSFDPERSDARPWLYGIAAKLVVDHHRRETRQRGIVGLPDRATDEHADEVADRVSAQSQQAILRAALDRLSDDDREVLMLIAWEELSYAEVAEAMRIPVGTVRSRLHRARQQIRRWLATAGNPTELTRSTTR
jgi:RNA polymerase sigma-70 factor (ECF subfamily)